MQGHISTDQLADELKDCMSCRQAELPASVLQRRFALALDAEAPAMFVEMAESLTGLSVDKLTCSGLQHCMLCRQGELPASALQQRFALALDAEAPGMFLELAELLPSPEQRSELLQAAQQAGWTAAAGSAGADIQEGSPLKVR